MGLYKNGKKIAGLYVETEIEHSTEQHAGVIQIASQEEVLDGTIDSKAVTPKKMKDTLSDVAYSGEFDELLGKPTNLTDFNDDMNIGSHISNNTIHVTASDKIAWSQKQNKLVAGKRINIDEETNIISVIDEGDKKYVPDKGIKFVGVSTVTIEVPEGVEESGNVYTNNEDNEKWLKLDISRLGITPKDDWELHLFVYNAANRSNNNEAFQLSSAEGLLVRTWYGSNAFRQGASSSFLNADPTTNAFSEWVFTHSASEGETIRWHNAGGRSSYSTFSGMTVWAGYPGVDFVTDFTSFQIALCYGRLRAINLQSSYFVHNGVTKLFIPEIMDQIGIAANYDDSTIKVDNSGKLYSVVNIDNSTVVKNSDGALASNTIPFVGERHLPYLTGDGTVGGVTPAATCSSTESGHPAYYGFSDDLSQFWGPSKNHVPETLTYYSPTPIVPTRIIYRFNGSSERFSGWTVYGSNDGSNFETIKVVSGQDADLVEVVLDPRKPYKFIQTTFTSRIRTGGWGKAHVDIYGVDKIGNLKIDGDTIGLNENQELAVIGLDEKQPIIEDLEEIRENAQTGANLAPQVATNTQRIEDLTVSKFPNATPIGKPQVQDSYVSGFSDSIYMIFPFTDISRGLPFDIYFSFTTGSDVTTQQNVLDSRFGMAVAIANGKGLMAISTNGTNWESGSIIGTNPIDPNTTYYVKLSWTGAQYTTAISTDNQTFTPDMVYNNSNSPYKTTIYIGGSPNLFGAGSAHPFKGIINFKGASVYLPTLGIDVWQGMADIGLGSRANVSLNNLDEVGEKRFSDKQDLINDLESIREGASKGATALQSFTETDPVYTADKPNLALKSELEAKQNTTDNTLTTEAKTIVGAINELNSKPSGAAVTFIDWRVN